MSSETKRKYADSQNFSDSSQNQAVNSMKEDRITADFFLFTKRFCLVFFAN